MFKETGKEDVLSFNRKMYLHLYFVKVVKNK